MTYLTRLLLTGLLALAAGGAQAATTVIHAGHLIAEPGKGAKAEQSVVIENGKIVAVKDGFIPADTVIDLKDSWVLPGLIDMHTHVSLPVEKDLNGLMLRGYMGRSAHTVLGALPIVKAVLLNGFTTVRDLGDISSTVYDLRDAINRGDVVGPRILASEPQFTIDGGDYDASRYGLRRDLEPYVTNRGTCTGVADCTRAVRQEVGRGADVIKLRQAGGSLRDPKIAPFESPEEMAAIVDTAHKLNRTVGAHVNDAAGARMMVAAGVDTIEHGAPDDATIALMKARGTGYTPTLLVLKIYGGDPTSDGRMRDIYQKAVAATGKVYRSGAPILFGSDLGEMGPERVWEEFGLLRDAGLPAEQTLRAATVNAANKLGRGDSLGSLAPGKIADIIAVKGDPVADLSVMKTVSFVMKDGKVFKDER